MEKGIIMDEDFEEDMTEEETIDVLSKLLDTILVFNKHFSSYVRQIDKDLFNRAVDYAKTFTEEDVSGIALTYVDDEKEENEEN